ncbi:MAG: hypothetical protein PHY59_05945 [Methanobacterium sp.]|nr:hypothetical protein [Methanobacterium sp.]
MYGIIFLNMHRKSLKKHLTMHGKNIKKLKIGKLMLQERKHPLKLHGLLLKKVIIKINQETG